MLREMSVNGSFYPNDTKELVRYFEHFQELYDAKLHLTDVKTKAIIVPHAGYIYSGFTASIAYRTLALGGIKKFIIIGPSHKIAFKGISLASFRSYDTPLGELASDTKLVQELKNKFNLNFIPDAHHEHSTEVQFPFIKHYIDNAKIVELVYGDAQVDDISKIITYVLGLEDCGVIISTDLSHFYTLEHANTLDNICLNAIKKRDVNLLKSGCEACGILGVEAMLISAKKLSLQVELLDYRTSADANEDTSKVVGYMSACFRNNT